MTLHVRIGATKFDHGQEGLMAYERCMRIAREFGYAGWMRESTMVTLLETYGDKKVEWGMRALHNRSNWSLGTLVKIIDGEIPPEHTAPTKASAYEAPAPRSERTSGGPRTVADLMQEHGVKLPKPAAKPGASIDGKFKLPEVDAWLQKRGIDTRQADQYFTYYGVDTGGNDLWVLLPEHLHPKKTS